MFSSQYLGAIVLPDDAACFSSLGYIPLEKACNPQFCRRRMIHTMDALAQTCDGINTQVTGIFFESKVDYTTWFGANVEYIHGIQVRHGESS